MAKYGHHDARGNLEFIADNLILLQDHLSGVNTVCPDCIVKHTQAIRAYATEGFSLDNANKIMPLLKECAKFSDDLIQVLSVCMVGDAKECRIHSNKDLERLVDQARSLRRKVNLEVYGLRGDLIYQREGHGMELGYEHGHNHDHNHGHAAELGSEIAEANHIAY